MASAWPTRWVKLLQHHLDEGRLPRKNGVRPHITVNTTLEGLKGELGAAAAELPGGTPISRKTVLHLPTRRPRPRCDIGGLSQN